MGRRIEIFFSYAHEDEALMDDVRRQLIIFERNNKILKWHDRQIPPGDKWENYIDQRLMNSDIILLFISPHFIESKYAYDVEMQEALKRHESRQARVIPIIVRPCPWQAAPFSKLQVLPKDGLPITSWPDRDKVCLDVAQAIMRMVEQPPDSHSKIERIHQPVQSTYIPQRMMEKPELPPIVCPDDPQKKRWGGRSTKNGRNLSAQLVEVCKKYFVFNLIVTSTDGSPLEGPVFFHLHDSFSRSIIKITKIRHDKTAILEEIDAEETFTAGVQVKDSDGTWIGLELDLEKLSAFKDFWP